MKPARKSVEGSRRPKLSASSGVYGSQPQPSAPDVLLKIVELVKKYYAKPSPQRQRGRPRTFSGLAFLLLTVVGMVLRTFKAVELHTRLTTDATLRQALGCDRVPHRRTLERRLAATRPEAEVQVRLLGVQILAEVTPGPEEPQASAIDGRLYQAQGPLWHKCDRDQHRLPQTRAGGAARDGARDDHHPLGPGL